MSGPAVARPGLGASPAPGYPPGPALPTRGPDELTAGPLACVLWPRGGRAAPGGVGEARSAERGAGQRGGAAAERGGAEPRACASEASASSVHTEDTSRHPHGNPDESPKASARIVEHPARAAWLAGVERETAEYREGRARGYERAARRKRDAAYADGYSEGYAKHKARWYLSRADGQRQRFDSVRGCEERTQIQIVCTACGLVAEHGTRCRIGIVCLTCRGKIASHRRGQFARARKVVLHRARERGLLNPKRRGGRHSEKLLTVTIPHLREHDVSQRIEFVRAAWPHFLKAMNAWLRDAGQSAEWLRHVEWTLGKDEQGHPHIHVWFFGPYLPRELAVDWWRDALVRGGFRCEDGALALREALEGLVVDLRAVSNGKVEEGGGIVTEVIKYMTKDIIKPGVYVAPETYARVYEALDGRRPMQASKGFMALGKEEVCCADCGAERSYLVRLRDVAGDDVAGAFGDSEPSWGPWRGRIEAQQRARATQDVGLAIRGALPAAEGSNGVADSQAAPRKESRQVRVADTELGRALRDLRGGDSFAALRRAARWHSAVPTLCHGEPS